MARPTAARDPAIGIRAEQDVPIGCDLKYGRMCSQIGDRVWASCNDLVLVSERLSHRWVRLSHRNCEVLRAWVGIAMDIDTGTTPV